MHRCDMKKMKCSPRRSLPAVFSAPIRFSRLRRRKIKPRIRSSASFASPECVGRNAVISRFGQLARKRDARMAQKSDKAFHVECPRQGETRHEV